MSKFTVSITVYASFIVKVEAKSEKDAIQKAYDSFSPSLCHQCSKCFEIHDLHESQQAYVLEVDDDD